MKPVERFFKGTGFVVPALFAAVIAILLLEMLLHIARPNATQSDTSLAEPARKSLPPEQKPGPRQPAAPGEIGIPVTGGECRNGFFLLFPARGGGVTCAANPAGNPIYLGPPDGEWFAATGGVPEIRDGDPVDDGLCDCLNALPAFARKADTPWKPPVEQAVYRGTRLPITKWVCGDPCLKLHDAGEIGEVRDTKESTVREVTQTRTEALIGQWLPGWRWVFDTQRTVLWIYLGLVGLMGLRFWLSLRLLALPRQKRTHFLVTSHVLSELTVNLPVVLGVVGTLIAIAYAVQDKFQGGPSVFVETFSGSFHIAVVTTICGGLVHACCFLLSAIDHWIVGKAES
uniref:MotA/TolQ/ExbB proton channel family protein n=1 Tax=Candidatus Kentrum sp. DK TaxID=2126562 RepID=A0A450RZX2_9GAMM|nr:MAG: hypothetical protein BECKDK2373C_GA0170839_100914 [Candidatus Kentron sp. DK]VFJ44839.1 MAG: hypothetical protein BECKDK2373B_GA0170837_100824 [Candidatus Kentron sp. DK]